MIKSTVSLFALLFILPFVSNADETADALNKATADFEKSCQQASPGSKHFFDCKCLSNKYAELPDNKLENQLKKAEEKSKMQMRAYLTKSKRFSKRYGEDNLAIVESVCLEKNIKNVKNKLRTMAVERKFNDRAANHLCSDKRKASKNIDITYQPVRYELAMTEFSVQNICIDPALIQHSANIHCQKSYKRAKRSNHLKKEISVDSFCKCYTDSYKKSINRGGSSSKHYLQREKKAYLTCIR